jgi:hypothetical protein
LVSALKVTEGCGGPGCCAPPRAVHTKNASVRLQERRASVTSEMVLHQKSYCNVSFAVRAVSTSVGTNHCPPGLNASFWVMTVSRFNTL